MNKKRILFFYISILAFFCNAEAYAQKILSGTKKIPLEVNILLESLQSYDDGNYEKTLPIVLKIDQYARLLTEDDIFFIGKLEVYKTLLKNYEAPIKKPIDGTSINMLRSAASKTEDHFIKWFLLALLKDCLDLTSSPAYKEFLLQKNSNVKIEKIEYRRLEKKGELLQFWISRISPDLQNFPENLKKDLAPKMFEALKNIQNSFYLIARESNLSELPAPLKNDSELKFFTSKTISSKAKAAPAKPTQKSVEDILAPLSPEADQILPAPADEKWLEDENTPPTLQNLPKPSNDADWLQDF